MTATTDESEACVLKIVFINDVYELDNFQYFATAKKQEATKISKLGGAEQAGLTIGCLAGDFLMPSLISSIDKGVSIVDCMSTSGIDYVCLGNHESDLDIGELHSRIKESTFTWVNSNMPNLPLGRGMQPLPEYVILEVSNSKGTHSRRIALLGLCCEDKSVMKPCPFGNCEILPINEKAPELYKYLMETERVDAVIPMTHQFMDLDRALAQKQLFPLILGGHEHIVFQETIGSCQIIKTGMEATNIAIIEVAWSSPSAVSPVVDIELKPAASTYASDAAMLAIIEEHKHILVELEKSQLFIVKDDLSSIGVRRHPTTLGTFLCSSLREVLRGQCCVFPGGCFRANKEYEAGSKFSYADLKAEIAFDSMVCCVYLPGQVIADMITFTRGFGLLDPPVEKGSYLQSCDSIEWDPSTNRVLTIGGNPFEPDQEYSCVVNTSTLRGMDNIVPLVEFIGKQSPDYIEKAVENSVKAKEAIVTHYSREILMDVLITKNTFDGIDVNHDGVISKAELIDALNATSSVPLTKLLINNLFSVADANDDGVISKEELIVMGLIRESAHQLRSRKRSSIFSVQSMLANVHRDLSFGEDDDADKQAFAAIREELHVEEGGTIKKKEMDSFSAYLLSMQSKKARI